MENQVKNAFRQIRMPEACALRIRQNMIQRSVPGRYYSEPVKESVGGWIRGAAALACLMAVAVLISGLLLRQDGQQNLQMSAGETTEETQNEMPAETQAEETTQPEEELLDPALRQAKADFENGLHYTDGRITYTFSFDEEGMNSNISYDTDLHSPWTDYVDGRVYFIANGENLDITDLFSEEEPFTYIYTDSHYIVHYIAIGGTPDNLGFLEELQMSWESGIMGGLGGFSINTWNYETEARFGWEQRAKKIFNEYGVHWAS